MSLANVGYVQAVPFQILEPQAKAERSEPKAKPPEIQSTKSQALDFEKIGQAFNRKLQFVVDHSSNEVLVKVIDKETDKVIKVIPPEELQRLHRNLKEAIGLLFSEKV